MSQYATKGKAVVRYVARALGEIIKLTGLGVFAIGFMALAGYMTGIVHLYRWSPTPMALNTSICFVLTGVGLFVAGFKISNGFNNANSKKGA